MIIEYLVFFTILAFLCIATLQDLKTKRIHNYLSLFSILIILILRIIESFISKDFGILYTTIIGMGLFFAIAYLIFSFNGFGGGDAKLLISWGGGIATTTISLLMINAFYILFLFLIVGTIYGLSIKYFLGFYREHPFTPALLITWIIWGILTLN